MHYIIKQAYICITVHKIAFSACGVSPYFVNMQKQFNIFHNTVSRLIYEWALNT